MIYADSPQGLMEERNDLRRALANRDATIATLRAVGAAWAGEAREELLDEQARCQHIAREKDRDLAEERERTAEAKKDLDRVCEEMDRASIALDDERANHEETRARLTAAEGDAGRMREALQRLQALDSPWPLVEVLTTLMNWSQHLLHEHDCDHHGYETLCAALTSTSARLADAKDLAALFPPTGHAAGEVEGDSDDLKAVVALLELCTGEMDNLTGGSFTPAILRSMAAEHPGYAVYRRVMGIPDHASTLPTFEDAALDEELFADDAAMDAALNGHAPPPVVEAPVDVPGDERPELTEWQDGEDENDGETYSHRAPIDGSVFMQTLATSKGLWRLFIGRKIAHEGKAVGSTKDERLCAAKQAVDNHPARIARYRLPGEARRAP